MAAKAVSASSTTCQFPTTASSLGGIGDTTISLLRTDNATEPIQRTRIVPANRPRDLLLLDEALARLQKKNPRKCQIVELKFFGGLSVEETASILQVSTRTVLRGWNAAKAWLYHEVKSK